MNASTIEKYADTLIWGLGTARKKGRFLPYETVMVKYHLAALPLAEALHKKLVQMRFNVIMRAIATPTLEKDFYACADTKQLQFVNAGEKELLDSLNGYIVLSAPDSLTHLKTVEPKKIGIAAVARKPLREIMDKREEAGKFSWTLCTYPTAELAKQAGLTLKAYQAQIEKACFLNEADPVKKWGEIYKNCQEIKKWLNSLGIATIRVQSAAMDLEIALGERRRFLGVSGHNIPSFEIFTSPDWRGTRGVYYSDLPSYRSGNYVKGITLRFEKGRAVKISARQGEAFVKKILAMDAGACQVGEFSLTDRRFSKITKFMADTLFDENYGGRFGNCHLAVGSAYSDTFAGNPKTLTKSLKQKLGFNDSSLHWDLVNTEDKRVAARLANGKTITLYERGEFKY